MILTKEKFKELWDSNESGGGITNDDCADCAAAWGLAKIPRIMSIDKIVYMVCKAANVNDMPEP